MPDRHSNQGKRIEVWADWLPLTQPLLVGVLFARPLRGREVYSFEYDSEWLAHPSALAIDPRLQLFVGPQDTGEPELNFSVFLDSSPDRWGRILMRRREALEAREQGRPARPLLHDPSWSLTICSVFTTSSAWAGCGFVVSQTAHTWTTELSSRRRP
jgi:hypothetical protein